MLLNVRLLVLPLPASMAARRQRAARRRTEL
jgi:hypothetical protein